MKKMRKFIILGIIVMIVTVVSGCNIKKNNSDNTKKDIEGNKTPEVVLNERQKEILEKEGLSTNPEELTYSQKKSIVAIEEMLTAIEKKYNRSFSYAGYVKGGALETEHIIAYPSDGDPEYDSFEVRKIKGDNGTEYEDDYMLMAIRDDYAEYITKITSEVLKTESVKVFSTVTYTTLTEVPSDEKMYNGTVSGINCIYIDGASINQEESDSYLAELEEKLYENKIDCSCGIICLKANELESVNQFNYSDYTTPECYIYREQIIVNVQE